MITNKRMNELIKEDAVIYDIFQGDIFLVDLTMATKFCDCALEYYNDYYHCNINRTFSDFYETREEAEWEQEFGYIARTERLKLPTWEDFIKNYQTLGDVTILDERCVMFTDKIKTYSLYADDNSIWVGCDNTGTSLFCEDLNKENYIKACRFCKRLFLGEVL